VSESTQGIRYDEPEQAKETKESVSKSDKSESSNTDAALQEKNKNPIETARSSMDVNEGNQLISENEKNLTLQPEIESSNPQGGIKAASNSDDDSHKESLTKITPAIKNPDKEIEPNKSDKSKKIKEESENQPEVPAIPTDPMAVIHQPLYVLSGNRTGQLRTPIPDLAKTLPMNSPIFDLPNPTVLVMTDADFEKSLRNLSYDQPTNRFIENLCLEKANIEPDSLDEVNPALSTEWYVNKIAKFAILKDFIARCSNRFNDKKSKRNKQCEKCNELLKTMANNNLRVLSQRLSQLSAECGKLSDIDSIKLHANKFNTLCNDMADFDKTLKISNNKINHAMKFKNSVTEEEVIIIINAAFNRYEAKVKDHAPANMSQITPAPNGSSDGKSNSRKNAKQDGCIIQ
jgi:hypothetical protein